MIRYYALFAGKAASRGLITNRVVVPGTVYSNDGVRDRSARIDMSLTGFIAPFSNT